MFSNIDIAEYYDTTQNHYERWWDLKKSHTLHYGIWEKDIKNFSESLVNTNKILMKIAQIKENDIILDAGCGIGGSALYLGRLKNVKVTGISLSENQIKTANQLARKYKLSDKLTFKVMDYTETSFNDESFDVVWACESICHAPDKIKFLKECYRILKKGGKLILSDYFITDENQKDKHHLIEKWMKTWSITNFSTLEKFIAGIKSMKFDKIQTFHYTDKIKKCSRRYFYYSLLGAIPSVLYNITHPKVSRFASTHYKSGFYQYRALKKELWKYYIMLAVK